MRAWFTPMALPVLDHQLFEQLWPVSHYPEKLIPLVISTPGPASRCRFGDGSNIRDWLFVATTARPFVACWPLASWKPITWAAGTKNQSGSRAHHLRPAGCLASAQDKRRLCRQITFVTDRPGSHVTAAMPSTPAKLHRATGFGNRQNLPKPGCKTVRWYPGQSGLGARRHRWGIRCMAEKSLQIITGIRR